MLKNKGRDAGRPRRLRIRTDKPPSPAASARRSGAGEGVAIVAVDRHKTAKTGRPSAATCKRRRLRTSIPASGQAKTPANPPLANNCSTHHALWRPPCTTTKRSGARPAAAQAGACGCHGGATSASQPPPAESCAKAGNNRRISPNPQRSTRHSTSAPRGQPLPGSSSSSSACPLGIVDSGRWASVLPRQTSPLASTAASGTGCGTAFTTGWRSPRE